MNTQPLSTDSEWTPELIDAYEQAIGTIAREKYGLDTYPIEINIISSEQMMDAYATVGMPVGYPHWSYGKKLMATEKGYRRGQMGLAYEIVINSNPCIAYLMEENSMTMQALVIAHACYGHNSFFKNNYLFQSWTNADAIIDYLLFAKNYILHCEEKFGFAAVEETLDACHALMSHGVDRYKRPPALSLQEEKIRQKRRENYLQSQVNDLWRTVSRNNGKNKIKTAAPPLCFPSEPQENLLYFLEKNAPDLATWQREIIRIVRKIAQYFYPQRQTQVMNEGWASFWHYTLMNDLYDQGLVTDAFMMEFLQSHTNVIAQPSFDSPYYHGINPYALGFGIYRDIRRICEHPTAEDRQWFPDLCGQDWIQSLDYAMRNFKDESFIAQYLSPHLIRELKLFVLHDDDAQKELEITAIHDDAGYQRIRESLSAHYNLSNREPDLQITHVNLKGDRSLTLRYTPHQRIPLHDDIGETLRHFYRLWKFPIHLEQVNAEGMIEPLMSCPK